MTILYVENVKEADTEKILDSLKKSGIACSDKIDRGNDDGVVDLTVIITSPVTDDYINVIAEIFPSPAEKQFRELAVMDVRERLHNLRNVADAYFQKK